MALPTHDASLVVKEGRPPLLSNQEVTTIIKKHFNFKEVNELSVKCLPSYRDRTYYFRGETPNEANSEFIFKLSNPLATSFDVMEGVTEVMKHLNSCSLVSPCPLASTMGKELVELSSIDLLFNIDQILFDKRKMKYPVYVLSFIPGYIFDHVEKTILTPAVLSEVGLLLGKMDKELMENFSNKSLASRKNPDWDLTDFLNMKRYLSELDSLSQIANAEKIFKAFEERVCPMIPSFKRGIIHGDLNGQNIVLKQTAADSAYHVAAFIDFNDAIETCVIFELGISLAYIMLENLTPVHCSSVVEFVGPLIGAYNSVLPLTAEELDCLYYLVLARCCQTALNGLRSHKVEPSNTYLLTTPHKSWMLIDQLLNTPKDFVDNMWKKYM